MTFTGNATNNNNRMDLYSYDSAGNLLNDGVHSYFYDAENHLIQVDGSLPYCTSNGAAGSAATACYYYDANGRRVHRTGYTNDTCDNTGKRDYIFDLEGRVIVENNVNGTACDIQVYAGERHFGRQGGGSFFYHSDWLGTVRFIISDQYLTRGSEETCTSLPFGDGLTCNSNASNVWHFTGKERDAESGLDNFGKRYFGSSLGRFQTPDPVLVSWRRMVNPQLWNAYSYVGNNPLRFVDPTGEELIQLGQHTDDEIKKRQKEIKQELKNKDLTKDQKNALKKESNTLGLEKQGNQVVGNLLSKLDQTGQRNGLQLSNFTLSTDTKNDFAAAATPAAMQKLLNDQAFVIQDNKQFSGTIYIRTEPETGFYQMSQRYSDFGYYGASAISHEQVHLNGGGEYPAYQRQLGVFEGFHNYFQNEDLYRGLDESIRDGIKANQPQ